MDKDYQLTYEKDGIRRKIDHLSAGEISLCALCFRLALIDNMPGDDNPFLIMDDPFVHLDDKNMKKVKSLINKISNNKQILYLTCSESRKIE